MYPKDNWGRHSELVSESNFNENQHNFETLK